MAQVITNENVQEFIEKGRVADFVAPAPEGEAKETKSGEEKPGEAPLATITEDTPKTETAPTTTQEPADEALPERVQKRINEKHRLQKEAEEWGRSQYLAKVEAEKRVAELESQLKKSKTPATDEGRAQAPKQEDFETVAAYVDAQVEWKLQQRAAEESQRKVETEQQAIDRAHQARIKAAMSRIADYADVVNGSDLVLANPLLQFIRESDAGPEVAYHLAKNPDVAERLNRLSPIKALAEIGKIEGKLMVGPSKAEDAANQIKPPIKTETSKAPAPITPIDGRKEPVQKDPSEMSFKEIRELERQKRMQAAKR